MNRKSCFKSIIKECVFVVIIIIFYSLILRTFISTKGDDPLVKLKTKYLGNIFNGWTISHFFFFAYLGYKYPDCFYQAQILGISWEIIEFSIGELLPILFPKIAFSLDPFWTYWYYGKWEDVLMNSLGFIAGQQLRKFIK